MRVLVLRVGWIFAACLVFACRAGAADLVDLNTAREDAIAKLPGVGPERAHQIVSNRLYGSMAELSKAGLSPDQIKQLSSVATVKPVQSERPGGMGGSFTEKIGAPGSSILASSAPGEKKRVAVLNFDYATVSPSVRRIFGRDVNIGKSVSEILVARLMKDGKYSVVEGKDVDKIMAEQDFSSSTRFDPNRAANLARQLGVDAIIVGSITSFDDQARTGGGKFSGLNGIGKGKRSTAVVQVTARLIDVHTGEVLAVTEGRGESKLPSASLNGSTGNAAGDGVNFASSEFSSTGVGEATGASLKELAGRLENAAEAIPAPSLTVAGRVAHVSGNRVVISVGPSGELKVGDVLQVVRVDQAVTDPATGPAKHRVETNLGTVAVTSVGKESAEGAYSGTPSVKVGDEVKHY